MEDIIDVNSIEPVVEQKEKIYNIDFEFLRSVCRYEKTIELSKNRYYYGCCLKNKACTEGVCPIINGGNKNENS